MNYSSSLFWIWLFFYEWETPGWLERWKATRCGGSFKVFYFCFVFFFFLHVESSACLLLLFTVICWFGRLNESPVYWSAVLNRREREGKWLNKETNRKGPSGEQTFSDLKGALCNIQDVRLLNRCCSLTGRSRSHTFTSVKDLKKRSTLDFSDLWMQLWVF